jgi:pimeloyl-ACP methyl ester carboxylesterase
MSINRRSSATATSQCCLRQRPRAKRASVVSIALMSLGAIGALPITSATHAQEAPSQIHWHECPPLPAEAPVLECGTLAVPLDYRAPHGETISIEISRLKARRPELRRGVLFTNPGGPGGAGITLPITLAAGLAPAVLERYDIIGIDPRFVGASTPLTCGLNGQEADQTTPPLEQPGGFAATAAFMKKTAEACGATSKRFLPFVTTANTARDFDSIRAALGEEKISYLGYSYGTYLGAVYASLFPHRTDRFVLDSNVHPGSVWREQFRTWGPAGEVRFTDFAEFAAAHDDKYHLGGTPAEVRETFLELVGKLDENPHVIGDDVLNGAMFRVYTLSGLYFDANFPSLAELWQQLDEAPSSLTQLPFARTVSSLADPPVDNTAMSGLAILCDDIAWSRDVERYRREWNADRAAYPLFGTLGSNIWACAFWPTSPIESPITISAVGPQNILLLQNLRDPVTPHAGGVGMRKALGHRARLITVDQGGHTAYGLVPVNACVNDAANAYLAYGTFPATDQFCPAETSKTQLPSAAARARAEKLMRERVIR